MDHTHLSEMSENELLSYSSAVDQLEADLAKVRLYESVIHQTVI